MESRPAPVTASQRHTRDRPCAVCGGHIDMPHGQGVRDYGFDSQDGSLCFCTNGVHAGALQEGRVGWVHRLDGRCPCGLTHGEAKPVPPVSLEIAARQSQARQDFAQRLWESTQAIPRTPGELYLRRRGITVELPAALRYIDRTVAPDGLLWPCMVAAVIDFQGHFQAVHRTFILRNGVKAPTNTPKAMLGPVGGGGVWLALPGPTVAVAEGIETALSVQQATGLPTCATLSTSGMKALVLPGVVREVYIAADNDQRGQGQAAATYAARRWAGMGIKVTVVTPSAVKDFNDLLRGAA